MELQQSNLPSKAELKQELQDLLEEEKNLKGNSFFLLSRQVAIDKQMEDLLNKNFEHNNLDKDLENFEHYVKLYAGLKPDEKGTYWDDPSYPQTPGYNPLREDWIYFFEKLRKTIERVQTEKPKGYDMHYQQSKRAQAASKNDNKLPQKFQSHANPYVLAFDN